MTGVELVGDFSLKTAATTGNTKWLVGGVLGYGALCGTLYGLLKSNKLAILNAYWDATSNVATYAMGWLWFGEEITPAQHLGFVLTAVGGWLLRP